MQRVFNPALPRCLKYSKKNGYIIIHDRVLSDDQTDALIKRFELKLIHSFKLDKSIWQREYFDCLETALGRQKLAGWPGYTQIMNDINCFRKAPLCSAFYIFKKV